MRYERQIYWGVIAWLFLGQYVYMAFISVPFIANSSLLSGLAKIFSLSDLLSDSINSIANGILNFWRLIPMLR